jgi:hypothetical protein
MNTAEAIRYRKTCAKILAINRKEIKKHTLRSERNYLGWSSDIKSEIGICRNTYKFHVLNSSAPPEPWCFFLWYKASWASRKAESKSNQKEKDKRRYGDLKALDPQLVVKKNRASYNRKRLKNPFFMGEALKLRKAKENGFAYPLGPHWSLLQRCEYIGQQLGIGGRGIDNYMTLYGAPRWPQEFFKWWRTYQAKKELKYDLKLLQSVIESERRNIEWKSRGGRFQKDNRPAMRHKKYHRMTLWKMLKYRRQPKFKLFNYFGCDLEFLIHHIESQFKLGQTWGNYGTKWEVDHIFPLSKFDLSKHSQRLIAFHFTNLQPMAVSENRRKRATAPKEHQCQLPIHNH